MSTAPLSVRPRARSPFGTLLRTELRLFLRNPGGVLWSAVAPVVALAVLAAVPSLTRPSHQLGGLSYVDAYLPILMLFSVCMAVVNVMPPELAAYRERGVLRRLSTTPVPPRRLLAAQAAIYVGAASVTVLALIVIAVCMSVNLPTQLAGLVLSLILVTVAATGIGLCVAALAPSAKIANAMSLGLFFPLMFLAGLWLPRDSMPGALRTISDYSPLGAGVRALQSSLAGDWPPVAALLVMVGYAVVLGLIAVRVFR